MADDRFDAGDEEDVAEREKKVQLEREREVEEFRVILSTRGGRNVVWRLLSMTGLFNSPIGETNDIMRQVGAQDLGRKFLAEVFTSDPGAYILMSQEAEVRQIEKEEANG